MRFRHRLGSTIKHRRRPVIANPIRFVIDFLPAEVRRITKNGFQLGLIRYWDPLLNQMFPIGTRVLVRYDPRDLSKVYVPSTGVAEYLDVPYADLRRPPITRADPLFRPMTCCARSRSPSPA